jgi:hypothetical protein
MADGETKRDPRLQTATVIAVSAVVANVVFFFLSSLYNDDHPIDLGAARMQFATMTVAIAGLAIAAVYATRWVAHGLAATLGLFELGGGVSALVAGRPMVLGVTLLVLGAVAIVLALRSLNRSRAVWAFLVAITSTSATSYLFGAPKVAQQLHISLWIALILPGLWCVATVALAMLRDDFRRSAAR